MKTISAFVICLLSGVLFATSEAEPLKAALYVDEGCRGNGVIFWAEMLRDSPDVDLKLVSGVDIRGGALDGCELLVMPGGVGGPQYKALGDDGAAKLKAFVADGGKYFGTCCGIAIALNEEPGFAKRLKMLPLKRKDGPARGGFTATVKFNARGREWLGIKDEEWHIRYHNGPVLQPADPVPECTELETLAVMDCELAQKGKVVERPRPSGRNTGRGRCSRSIATPRCFRRHAHSSSPASAR